MDNFSLFPVLRATDKSYSLLQLDQIGAAPTTLAMRAGKPGGIG
jgi:hypothetical protein